MTMKAIREEIARQHKAFPTLTSFIDEIERTVETLWKNGSVSDFSNDILRMANGFVACGGDLHIMQTLDLHSITVDSKAAVKAFAEYMLTC